MRKMLRYFRFQFCIVVHCPKKKICIVVQHHKDERNGGCDGTNKLVKKRGSN